MLALSLRGAERRSNLDLGAHCPTRLLRGVYPRAAQSADPWARNDSHSIGFDQPDLVLLALASQTFDVFTTVDRNLSFQQNLAAPAIAVIVLHARTNRLAGLRRLVPQFPAAIASARPGPVTVVGLL